MARRRQRDDLAVSLFPFLSVLACVIGTLTLLLAALAVQRLGSQSLERVRLAAARDAALEAVAAGRVRLEEIEAQLRDAQERARADDDLGARLIALGLSPDISLDELTQISNLLEEGAKARRRTARLESERASLVAEAVAREDRLAERRAAEVSLPIVIDPTGLGPSWKPYLVECTKDYIDLRRVDEDWSFRILRDELPRSDDWYKYLRRIKAIPDAIVIFMLRPEGVATYEAARAIADRHHVRHAKLPLPGDGRLDFSQFAEGGEAS